MSDASKSQRPSATPIKNPLLSASVTGLAADFPNNLILLPAAPPIVQTPVAPPSGLLSREPKSLVTLGSSSLDTENLDEINLNASNEDQQPPSIALTTDANANTLLEQANNTNDSILSQAASSFSALPSVASNVFSTFSKRINAISSSRETTPISNDRFPEQFQQTDLNANNASLSQLNIQPAYIQQQQQQIAQDANYLQQQTPIQPFFGAAPQVQTAGYQTFQPEPIQNLPPAEPPKFYTPADIPLPSTAPPLASGGGNNFRFSAKKKLYAPIPGLTDQQAVPIFDPSAVSAPIIPEQPPVTPYQQNTYPAPPPIESKVGGGGGLFSKITNLAPSGVLQNITGLVQSAAGSFTQTPRSDTSLQQQQQQPHQTLEYSGFDVFATQPTEIYSTGISETTPAANFFVHPPPPGQQPVQLNLKPSINQNQTAFTAVPNFPPQPEPTINFFDTTNSQAQSSNSSVNFFQAAQTLPATQQNIPPPPLACPTRPTRPSSRPPSHCADFVTNEALPPPSSWNSNQQPSTVNLFDPSKFLPANNQNNFAVPEPASKPSSRPASQPSVDNTPQGSVPLFDPSKYLQSTNQVFDNKTIPQPIADNNSGITAAKPSSRPPSQPNTAVVANNPFAPPLANSAADSVALFDPTKYLPTTNNQTNFAASPAINPLGFVAPPPTLPPTLPPPSGQTSHFRLQKGTRLYKNPLTAQETAPVQVTPAEIQQPLAFGSSATPFGLPNTHVDSYGQHINQQEIKSVPSFFVPSNSEAQSVPLFAPSVEETEKESNTKPQIESSLGSATAVAPNLFLPNAEAPSVPLLVEPPKEYQEQQNIATQPDSNFAPSAPQISNETASAAEQSDLFVSNSSDTQSLSLFAPPIIEYQAEVEESPQNQTILQSNNLTQFEKSSEDSQDSSATDQVSEATLTQNLQTISSASEPQPPPPPASFKQEAAQIPPPSLSESNSSSNPYRRGSASGGPAKSHVNQTILASFFTPSPSTNTSSDFNFFGSFPAPTDNKNNEIDFFVAKDNQESISVSAETIPSSNLAIPENSISNSQEQSSATNLQQPTIACFFAPSATEGIVETSNIPNPIGFEKFGIPASDSAPVPAAVPAPIIVNENLPELQQTEQNPHEVVKRFSNIFQQTNPIKTENPSQFFDNFETQQQQDLQAEAPTQACKEDQRIQNFFNNPPPQDANKVGDLNYDLVHSGLAIKDLQHRSLITPISNLVEPSSSACSEFSEFSNITNTSLSQRSAAITSETVTQISPEKLTLPVQTEEEDKQPFIKRYEDLPEEILKELRMANQLSAEKGFGPTTSSAALYKPVVKHWFYKRIVEQKPVWTAFSHYDSALLETAYLMDPAERPNIVAVEGSRYDVNIAERKKMSAYWESDPIEVRRCSWFCKAPDSKYIPYEENIADLLEEQYKIAFEAGEWPKTIMLNMGEKIVFHGPAVIVHMQEKHNVDAWGGSTQTSTRPRVVERDLINIKIEQGESQKVDHLLFMVHGIGSACDLKMRPVEEVVEDFRTIAYQLVQSHYKNSTEVGVVGRVEVLPISWHSQLHSDELGVDKRLKAITLDSMPTLRNFTNDTLLDILFYTSPQYCQKIMDTVAGSLNDIYTKFRARQPEFNGGVSLAGHSLGSLILFDLLCHQNPIKECEDQQTSGDNQSTMNAANGCDSNLFTGSAGTGQPVINYCQLIFQPKKFFALGSPIGMFVTIRGIHKLGLDFRLPTCPGFYNIFHPYDPVAYRIEALVNPDITARPVLIPHHKGRKRMHLELKETMTRVSMDLKNRFFDKFKNTLDSYNIFGLSSSPKSKKEDEKLMKEEVEKVIEMQMQLEQQQSSLPAQLSPSESIDIPGTSNRQRTDSVCTAASDDMMELDMPLGKLNDSKRIDYVLQEAPLEIKYIFALSSHVCYWDSEDTILFVMKEIYTGLGVSPDSQIPQQSMTIERPSSRNSLIS